MRRAYPSWTRQPLADHVAATLEIGEGAAPVAVNERDHAARSSPSDAEALLTITSNVGVVLLAGADRAICPTERLDMRACMQVRCSPVFTGTAAAPFLTRLAKMPPIRLWASAQHHCYRPC